MSKKNTSRASVLPILKTRSKVKGAPKGETNEEVAAPTMPMESVADAPKTSVATAATEATTLAVPEAPAQVDSATTLTEPTAAAPPPAAATPAEAPQGRKMAKVPKEAKPKKMSALDAAAKVLSEAGTALNCQEMIDAMAKAQLWSSPKGQTPAATLYSAILREINTKGQEARFQKTERGKFAAKV